jgi:outer membrane usher protein
VRCAGSNLTRFLRKVVVILLLAVTPLLARAGDQPLLLELRVNGFDTEKIGEFALRNGTLAARRSELRDLGFQIPNDITTGSDGLVALSALPGLTWRIDETTQTLYVTAADDLLLPTLLQIAGRSHAATIAESGTGATLNYDIADTTVSGRNSAAGQFDLRAFSPWGVASSGLLAYAGGGPNGPGTTSAVRLDSTYTFSDPDTLLRYRLGDVISGGLSWTRPVRLGGAQVITDFSMRPDLVTFPLPSLSGSAAVPSTVDVLVNGSRLLSQQVQPGPFALPQLPVVTGAGTVSMTLTNALGQQVVQTLPFYASAALLSPGQQALSAQMGALRRNWGLVSNDYGDFAASATWRRGLSSAVTVEASAEGTAGTLMSGAGVVVNVGNFAILNAAAAASTGSAGTGTQFSVGVSRQSTVFSFGASVTAADHNFRDVASMSGDPVPQLQINASAGLSMGRFGSVGIAYAGIDLGTTPSPISVYVPPGSFIAGNTSAGGIVNFQQAQHTHILSASYSISIHDMSVYVTGFHDFANSNSNGVMVGLVIPTGTRSSVGASVGSGSGSSYAQVQAQQSPVVIGDWGYQVDGSFGNPGHTFAQAQYKSPWALLSAGADHIAQQTSLRLESQGAVSLADYGLFASNTINDSFGVVDTNGLPHVHVTDENLDVGTTDSAGRLLVPDLRSFEVNHIAIDPADLPPDVSIDSLTREVRPQDRSAVVIKFALKNNHGALLQLVNEAGTPIAIGSSATLRATGTAVPVGYDGNAYVQGLEPHNELDVVQLDGGQCSVAFDYHPVPGDIPKIGPLTCRERRQ